MFFRYSQFPFMLMLHFVAIIGWLVHKSIITGVGRFRWQSEKYSNPVGWVIVRSSLVGRSQGCNKPVAASLATIINKIIILVLATSIHQLMITKIQNMTRIGWMEVDFWKKVLTAIVFSLKCNYFSFSSTIIFGYRMEFDFYTFDISRIYTLVIIYCAGYGDSWAALKCKPIGKAWLPMPEEPSCSRSSQKAFSFRVYPVDVKKCGLARKDRWGNFRIIFFC